MVMIRKNNQSIKYSLTDPKLRNPSIPYKKKLNDERDLGPGSYDPKDEVIQKNTKSIRICNPIMIKDYNNKKQFINDPGKKASMDRAKRDRQVRNISQEEDQSVYNTISYNTMLKEDEIGSSIFVSKTKRGHSVSHVPGPGSYDTAGKKEEIFGTGSFGSGVERKTDILKNNVKYPFTQPTYLENPPVGYYNGSKALKNKSNFKHTKPNQETMKLQNQLIIKGSRATSEGFNSTSKRELNRTLYNNGVPGPGAYDLTFRDIIKTMDQKLAIRYQISPFGSGKPRFMAVNNTIDVIQEESQPLSGVPPRDKHLVSDLMNEHFKKREFGKNSSSFASKVNRFKLSKN